MKYVVLLSLLMLTNQFCFSQTQYPKKAVIDKDTVCILSIDQVRSANKIIVDRQECYELRDSLKSQISNYDKLTKEQKNIISSQDKEIEIQKNIVAEKDNIKKMDEKMLKKMERKAKWLKLQRNGLAVLSVGLGIAILIL